MPTMTRQHSPAHPPHLAQEPAQELIPAQGVIGGVDTHRDQHVCAAIDSLGRLLAVESFDTNLFGYRSLLQWLESFGQLVMIGVEGTGSYGLGLARYLAENTSAELVEVDRPNRRTRRLRGKSGALDAEAAARTALARDRTAIQKIRDGQVEALRNLRVARRSAVEQRADVLRQIKSLIITAPDQLRQQLSNMKTPELLRACAALRPDRSSAHEPTHATKLALRSLAKRHHLLTEEIKDLEHLINPLVKKINPALLAIKGVGPDSAGQFLITAGANPERIGTEAAFAMLCGAAPIPASSGQTQRVRLSRSGDRQANAALYRILLTRMSYDPATQAYLKRRVHKHDLTHRQATRMLKRYIAREIYPALINPHHGLDHP